jgi:hypothetical protein
MAARPTVSTNSWVTMARSRYEIASTVLSLKTRLNS